MPRPLCDSVPRDSNQGFTEPNKTMKIALLFTLLTSGFLLQSREIVADESGSGLDRSVPAQMVSGSDENRSWAQTKKKLSPEQQERRKQILSASWIMLIGVAILGGILLLIVFIIGSRLRRIARKPLPDAPLRDPMWYLKNKTPQTPGTAEEPADSDHE